MGFDIGEIETYMKLLLEQEDTEEQRLKMLNQKRSCTLMKSTCGRDSCSGWITCATISGKNSKKKHKIKPITVRRHF